MKCGFFMDVVEDVVVVDVDVSASPPRASSISSATALPRKAAEDTRTAVAAFAKRILQR